MTTDAQSAEGGGLKRKFGRLVAEDMKGNCDE